MKKPERSKCSICGFTWMTGQDETHSCTENLLKTINSLKESIYISNVTISDQVVFMQSAWIEWQRGGGAEKAMTKIHERLAESESIPDLNITSLSNSQDWYDAHCAANFNKTKIADS